VARPIIKRFIAALQFLTIFRIKNDLNLERSDFSASLAFFPFIGLLLGLILALLGYLFAKSFPTLVAGAMLCAFHAFFTRGLHLDGLADVADALGSHKPREQALKIMKDSCTGAIGVIALALALILKSSALGELVQSGAFKFIILVPCLARFSLNVLAALSVYARPEGGLGESFVGTEAKRPLVPAFITALLAGIFLAGIGGFFLVAAIMLLAAFFAFFFKKRLGGVTGDVLGFQVEISETILLIIGTAMHHG